MSSLNVDIIVARYNEDLKWTLEYPFNQFQYIVYNKGPNQLFEKSRVKRIMQVPNVGRCDHTYLYHITHHFNTLADINVFFPGSVQMDTKKQRAINILERIIRNDYQEAVFIGKYSTNILKEFHHFTLETWKASDPQNISVNNEQILQPSILKPFGKWFRHHFGNIPVHYRVDNSIFAVHKKDIVKHDISRYQKLVMELASHSNPEVGHYCERAWGAIFYPLLFTKVLLE